MNDIPTSDDYDRFVKQMRNIFPTMNLRFCSDNHAEGFFDSLTQACFKAWWEGYKARYTEDEEIKRLLRLNLALIEAEGIVHSFPGYREFSAHLEGVIDTKVPDSIVRHYQERKALETFYTDASERLF